jgi:ATP-binding cassette, subfamily C, bacterial CydC
MRTLIALFRFGRPPGSRIALVVGLGSIAVLSGVGLMGIAGYLISRAAEHPPILSLTVAIVAVRACGLAKPIARYFERLEAHDLAFRTLAGMRGAFFRRLEPLGPADIQGYRNGDLLARMVGDVDAMQNLFLRGIGPALIALVAGVTSVAIVASFEPTAGAILALGLLVGGFLLPVAAAAAAGRASERSAIARGELTAELVDVFRGAPELVAMGAEGPVLDRIRNLDGELGSLARRDAVLRGITEGGGLLVAGLTVVGVLVVAALSTASGDLDRALVAALALGALASFEAIAPLPGAALALRSTFASGRRLLDIAGRDPAVIDPRRPTAAPTSTAVDIDGVSFDHGDGQTWGLRDIDLVLPPGRRVALVGESGAGKSTVAELLVRFVDPDAGRIRLGGDDVRDVRQQDLRSAISLDAQDPYLFSSTIVENVRLARPDATNAEIRLALRRARLEGWVDSLPDGWDTFVGEAGTLVSGGERRRIALARTFLADSKVIVLDEPTAHLDAANADAIVADALAASDGRSVVLITHGTEGLAAVDEIVTLHRGRIVARREDVTMQSDERRRT